MPQQQRLGTAILRLLNYCEQLASFEHPHSLDAWRAFVQDFYIENALCTYAIPHRDGAVFEIPTPLLSRYYHDMHRDVAKLNLTFHDAREYYTKEGNHVVECPQCTLCYFFPNLTKVEIVGKLKLVFTNGLQGPLKIECWEFFGQDWDEWLCRRSLQDPLSRKDLPSAPTAEDTAANVAKRRITDAHLPMAMPNKRPKLEIRTSSDDLFGEDGTSPGPESDLLVQTTSAGRNLPDRRLSPGEAASASPDTLDATIPGTLLRTDSENTRQELPLRKRMVLREGVTARHLRTLEMADCWAQLAPLFSRVSGPAAMLDRIVTRMPAMPGAGHAGTNAAAAGAGAAPLATPPLPATATTASKRKSKAEQAKTVKIEKDKKEDKDKEADKDKEKGKPTSQGSSTASDTASVNKAKASATWTKAVAAAAAAGKASEQAAQLMRAQQSQILQKQAQQTHAQALLQASKVTESTSELTKKNANVGEGAEDQDGMHSFGALDREDEQEAGGFSLDLDIGDMDMDLDALANHHESLGVGGLSDEDK